MILPNEHADANVPSKNILITFCCHNVVFVPIGYRNKRINSMLKIYK